ncbi:MAG: hydroxyacid dehydrogenase [Thermomicrobiales bacterium]
MNAPNTPNTPNVLVLPGPTLYRQLFSPAADERLRAVANVTFNDSDEAWSSTRLATVIGDYDGLITGWRSPRLTAEVLNAATRLRIVAHSAGSVKAYIPEAVLERGIKVSSAAIAMSPAVAEFSLILVFLGLRPVHEYDFGMRRGGRVWANAAVTGLGREIAGSRIGVVGAGGIGRIFIRQLKALGAEPWVFDPYLSEDAAMELGAHQISLDVLMAECPIVVNHAPTPETHHMIGKEQLALMQDGAYLVNTARSWVINQEALLAELETGRIRAALDVFDTEPLPLDHPFRSLPNVILTPHVAGATHEGYYRQGDCAVRDIANAFSGRPLAHEVTPERYAILA